MTHKLYELDCNGPGYLVQTRGNLGKVRLAILCQKESCEVILKYIWGTNMILNSQFKIKSVKK